MEKVDILEQLSKEALLMLEKKAFATKHRGQYLLEKEKRMGMGMVTSRKQSQELP